MSIDIEHLHRVLLNMAKDLDKFCREKSIEYYLIGGSAILSEYLSASSTHYHKEIAIPKPINFDKMISMAESLSKPFPCVRVDLYNIDGKIYFGEMTFTSRGGLMNSFTDEFLNKAGDMIDLNYRG